MAKGQKTIYKNSAVILRLVLGILSIVISAVVGFQSCAAGIGEAISEAESSSGAGGLFTGFFLLAAGEQPQHQEQSQSQCEKLLSCFHVLLSLNFFFGEIP